MGAGAAHPDAKAFTTLQAKAALAGWHVERMADSSVVVARWTLTRSLPDVPALATFLREVGVSAKFSRQAAEQRAAFDGHIVQFTAKVKEHAVNHIAQRADAVTRRTLGLQVQAMEESARALFLNEVRPELRQLCQPLERLYAVVQESSNPWNAWLTHAATATLASVATWVVTSGVLKP